MNDAFDFTNRVQRRRSVKGFEVTFLRIPAESESIGAV
jgi:hypothetical protein